jgi:hypothetical protein
VFWKVKTDVDQNPSTTNTETAKDAPLAHFNGPLCGTICLLRVTKQIKLRNMARYTLFVFCRECAGVHEMGINVTLTDGPVERQSIGDAYTYQGKAVPPKLAFLLHNRIKCPNTGNSFIQPDTSQVFLVPIE